MNSIQHTKQIAEPLFSYFKKPVRNIFPIYDISIVKTYELIKSNQFFTITNQLRAIKCKKEAKAFKAANFDYITFSGSFSQRKDSCLKSHSGLITIDLDDLEQPLTIKNNLLNDDFLETALLFLSPSGKGLKWIIEIDLKVASHEEYFIGISNYLLGRYSIKVDPSGSDVSRACFVPHDFECFINPKYIKKNEKAI